MKITDKIHALKIPFKIPVGPAQLVERFAYSYIVFGDRISIIDSGVSGADELILGYIEGFGRNVEDVSSLILTHSHPDHIGSAKGIKERTGCSVIAHENEKHWIEDTEKQFQERPVPGFHTLIDGPVKVDITVEDGDVLTPGGTISCTVLHTPGHSKGSLSLLFEDKTLITGDLLLPPGDLPIYENIFTCISSIERLKMMEKAKTLLSSWEEPIMGKEEIKQRIERSLKYFSSIHETVQSVARKDQDRLELCKIVVEKMGLPPFAVNPLVANAMASSLL